MPGGPIFPWQTPDVLPFANSHGRLVLVECVDCPEVLLGPWFCLFWNPRDSSLLHVPASGSSRKTAGAGPYRIRSDRPPPSEPLLRGSWWVGPKSSATAFRNPPSLPWGLQNPTRTHQAALGQTAQPPRQVLGWRRSCSWESLGARPGLPSGPQAQQGSSHCAGRRGCVGQGPPCGARHLGSHLLLSGGGATEWTGVGGYPKSSVEELVLITGARRCRGLRGGELRLHCLGRGCSGSRMEEDRAWGVPTVTQPGSEEERTWDAVGTSRPGRWPHTVLRPPVSPRCPELGALGNGVQHQPGQNCKPASVRLCLPLGPGAPESSPPSPAG